MGHESKVNLWQGTDQITPEKEQIEQNPFETQTETYHEARS